MLTALEGTDFVVVVMGILVVAGCLALRFAPKSTPSDWDPPNEKG